MAVVRFRHILFDRGLLKSQRFDTPTICVGNITVGGCGKSPMCEFLLDHLTPLHPTALLSRGYGRRTKGYLEVSPESHYREVGDEPLQIKCKYPATRVVVCESRVEGISRIEREHPEVELIIMDDGFQHRYVTPRCNIIMVDSTRPPFEDKPLPLGSLRDSPERLTHADIFVVTKCGDDMTEERMEIFRRELICREGQQIYFSRVVNAPPRPLLPSVESGHIAEVIALSGIANPAPFNEWVERNYTVVDTLNYPDHHSYSPQDLEKITRLLERAPEAVVITTEKDAVKLLSKGGVPKNIEQRIYYTPIKMELLEGSSQGALLKKIESYVQ